MSEAQRWQVVGGADKGGILVRSGQELTSAQVDPRLATGATVKQLDLRGDRLQYELLEGSGPSTGWVSLSTKDKVLLIKLPSPAVSAATGQTIFDFTVPLADGSSKKLEAWKSTFTLIVNTASKCGFTGQYEGLQKLQDRFGAAGLQVMAFPCNQFMSQEPGDDRSIQEFVKSKYGVTFPVFAKVDVNGSDRLPLFEFLKGALDDAVPRPPWAKNLHPVAKDIQWNFTKFLCVAGVPKKRYSFDVDPATVAQDIEAFQSQGVPKSSSTKSGKRSC